MTGGITKFASENPWLTFFMFWILIVTPFKCIAFCWNRYLRTKNIALRGWPTTPNMDADGDIVHPEKSS